MALSVKHAHTAGGVDDPTKEVSKDRWNADHTLECVEGVVLGRRLGTGTGTVEELTPAQAREVIGANGLVGSTTLGVAANTITVTGLDLANDGTWIVELRLKNASGVSSCTVSMYLHGDTTAANYQYLLSAANSASIGSAGGSGAVCTDIEASDNAIGVVEVMRDVDGYTRTLGRASRASSSSLRMMEWIVRWNSTTNPTSLTISGSQNFAAGSSVKVFRRKN